MNGAGIEALLFDVFGTGRWPRALSDEVGRSTLECA